MARTRSLILCIVLLSVAALCYLETADMSQEALLASTWATAVTNTHYKTPNAPLLPDTWSATLTHIVRKMPGAAYASIVGVDYLTDTYQQNTTVQGYHVKTTKVPSHNATVFYASTAPGEVESWHCYGVEQPYPMGVPQDLLRHGIYIQEEMLDNQCVDRWALDNGTTFFSECGSAIPVMMEYVNVRIYFTKFSAPFRGAMEPGEGCIAL